MENQNDLLAAVDELTGNLMRKILHHPRFQALESAWRGLYFLVKRIETNSELKNFICDIGKENLSNHLKSFNNLTDSEFFDFAAGNNLQSFDDNNWSVICGNYEFTFDIDDIAFLIRLAKISSVADAPFISYLIAKTLYNHSLVDVAFDFALNDVETNLWDLLRSIPESSFLGFALPRFLDRLPFNENIQPIETFFFDELMNSQTGNNYIWTYLFFSLLFYLLKVLFTMAGKWNIIFNFR